MASDDRETDHVIHSLAYRGPSLPKDANSFKEFYCRILAFFIIVLFSYLSAVTKGWKPVPSHCNIGF